MKYSKFEQGDIFIAKNPFSNLQEEKVRPAIVVSPNYYNNLFDDIVILGITSKDKDEKFSIKITNSDLKEEKLRVDSNIRVDKPLSISKDILEHKITSLKPETLRKLKEKIKEFYQL